MAPATINPLRLALLLLTGFSDVALSLFFMLSEPVSVIGGDVRASQRPASTENSSVLREGSPVWSTWAAALARRFILSAWSFLTTAGLAADTDGTWRPIPPALMSLISWVDWELKGDSPWATGA